jgi:hypothetical protein
VKKGRDGLNDDGDTEASDTLNTVINRELDGGIHEPSVAEAFASNAQKRDMTRLRNQSVFSVFTQTAEVGGDDHCALDWGEKGAEGTVIGMWVPS